MQRRRTRAHRAEYTRVVVFGGDGKQARHVAEAVAREAFHNVSFFEGSYEEFVSATRN
jgi:3-mercaptopyruvate sulfurtransferase SseA